MQREARGVQDGTVPRVGVNVFQVSVERDTLLKAISETKIEPCGEQIERVREFKRTRDLAQLVPAMRQVFAHAKTATNLLPAMIAAMEAGATTGEIAGALRVAYGAAYDPFGATQPEFPLAA